MFLLNHCSVQTEITDNNPPETEAICNLNSKFFLQSFLLPALIFITLCFAAPAAVSQETTDSDLSQSLEEDTFAESDPELGLDEDPLAESDPELGLDEDPLAESGPELRTDEDALVETSKKFGSERDLLEEASPELGIEKDPLAKFDQEQVFKEDPLQKASPELGSSEDQVSENDGALGLNEDPFSGDSAGSDQQEVLEFEEETPVGDEQLLEEEEFRIQIANGFSFWGIVISNFSLN